VDDDRQKRLMYAAVDLTAVPSRSESLGYVAMESMACGTPCVGFSIGGLPDIVDHRVNGFLAEPYSTNDFSAGITWLLAERACSERVCSAAREKIIAKFCHIKTAQQYRDSYVRSFGEKLL
jgi:glycosyltransferase involved in cell wall biosynthesis